MPSAIWTAVVDPAGCIPKREGESLYQRRKQLVEIARLASLGSTVNLHRLARMAKENKADAWTYSKADVKAKLKAIFDGGAIDG